MTRLSIPDTLNGIVANSLRAQKALSRKKKGSSNRHKARIKVALAHGKIADSRKDELHKLTTQLVRENQTIVVEDLAVKNMVKNRSQAFPPSHGGKQLLRALAQSISDAKR